eukprot:TRINITY_DN169_c0_g1_i4.p2 TRINITY_DN169_c0_g1~~TRINITY_DN169_c0_g1_i4.p2  ORF type:complete len:103 (-),score=10.26 TRINITY_DN169_c0_g1_i4:918-1226(-)
MRWMRSGASKTGVPKLELGNVSEPGNEIERGRQDPKGEKEKGVVIQTAGSRHLCVSDCLADWSGAAILNDQTPSSYYQTPGLGASGCGAGSAGVGVGIGVVL